MLCMALARRKMPSTCSASLASLSLGTSSSTAASGDGSDAPEDAPRAAAAPAAAESRDGPAALPSAGHADVAVIEADAGAGQPAAERAEAAFADPTEAACRSGEVPAGLVADPPQRGANPVGARPGSGHIGCGGQGKPAAACACGTSHALHPPPPPRRARVGTADEPESALAMDGGGPRTESNSASNASRHAASMPFAASSSTMPRRNSPSELSRSCSGDLGPAPDAISIARALLPRGANAAVLPGLPAPPRPARAFIVPSALTLAADCSSDSSRSNWKRSPSLYSSVRSVAWSSADWSVSSRRATHG
mmetsp:Transcript_35799/g.105839  ORF Transcript_35799/g.105839 Transcript_35799/m.105839 type:complete len:308 (+) Transcript_35799:1558-2481(+)